jgi:hypothetical protein
VKNALYQMIRDTYHSASRHSIPPSGMECRELLYTWLKSLPASGYVEEYSIRTLFLPEED